jgi:membrane peptidoglycan carboxypeptidase
MSGWRRCCRRGGGDGIRRRWGVWLVVALFLWGALETGLFYRRHWHQLEFLPSIVAASVRRHHGRMITLGDVSPWLPKALIATEDRSFYTNWGVSFEGVGRSLWVDIVSGRFVEGGSTLTQQLVRDQLLGLQKTIRRKLSEALLSVAVTVLYPKRDILSWYLSSVYLGNGYWGAYPASIGYFGVTPRHLTEAQAALLAGLPQAPSFLDPFRHYRAARRREWEVLESMVADHLLTQSAAERVYQEPLDLRAR